MPISDKAGAMIVVLALVGAVPASADEDPVHNLTVGAGVGVTPSYEGADEYRAFPFMPLRYESKWVKVQTIGLGLEFDISPTKVFAAGPMFRFRFARDNDVSDSRVRALPEVGESLELGGFLRSGVPLQMVGFDDPAIIFAQTSVRQDVLDGHGGLLVDGSIGVTRPFGERWNAVALGTATYASEKYMSSYFDVTAAGSAASGLAIFDADAGIKDVGLTGILTYKLNEKWSLVGFGNFSRLVGDAASSPVVSQAGSENQFSAGFAINYKIF